MRTITRRIHAAFTAGPNTTRVDTYIALTTVAVPAYTAAWVLSHFLP